MYKILFPLALCPKPRWGGLTALPQTTSCILRAYILLKRRKGKTGEGKREGKDGEVKRM